MKLLDWLPFEVRWKPYRRPSWLTKLRLRRYARRHGVPLPAMAITEEDIHKLLRATFQKSRDYFARYRLSRYLPRTTNDPTL